MTADIDPSLMPGAVNAISTCMNVREGERVWILTDESRSEIGEALAEAARSRGADVTLSYMESYGARPFDSLPPSLAAELRALEPEVTLLATSALPGELRFRLPLARCLRRELRVRHGHMIGVDRELMLTGMRADYRRVAALTLDVAARMAAAREVEVTSPSGTCLKVTLDNERHSWVPFHGLYHEQGQWGTLPEGESCTTPAGVSGVLCAELLGDYFCQKYGVLSSPIAITLSDGWVTGVEHEDSSLSQELWEYLAGAENGRRVGEFAIGTNEALRQLSGNLLQDEKFPGVHLAFGNPVPEVTGQSWGSNIHVDAVATRCTVLADGEMILDEGRFLI